MLLEIGRSLTRRAACSHCLFSAPDLASVARARRFLRLKLLLAVELTGGLRPLRGSGVYPSQRLGRDLPFLGNASANIKSGLRAFAKVPSGCGSSFACQATGSLRTSPTQCPANPIRIPGPLSLRAPAVRHNLHRKRDISPHCAVSASHRLSWVAACRPRHCVLVSFPSRAVVTSNRNRSDPSTDFNRPNRKG